MVITAVGYGPDNTKVVTERGQSKTMAHTHSRRYGRLSNVGYLSSYARITVNMSAAALTEPTRPGNSSHRLILWHCLSRIKGRFARSLVAVVASTARADESMSDTVGIWA